MRDGDRLSSARAMAASVDELINFADQLEDHLLAAKLEDIRHTIIDRYLASSVLSI